MKVNKIFLILSILVVTGCAPKHINVAVDTLVIEDQAKYEADKANCTNIAMTYSLADERLIKAGYIGLAAGSSVAGMALIAGYGAINPVAIPFIVGATLVGAGLGSMSPEERLARENILYQCLAKHGYTVYSAH
jgi:hypothetical protein